MKAFASIAILVAAMVFVGCAHSVHQVHTSDFNPYKGMKEGQMVKGYAEQFVIMGFVDDTAYVNQAYQQLQAACPSGSVSGITTQIWTSLGFFSWTNKALMQGLCVRSN